MNGTHEDVLQSLERTPSKAFSGGTPHPPVLTMASRPSSGGRSVKYPVIKQTGFYSDILSHSAFPKLKDFSSGPNVQHNLLRQADLEQNTPKVTSFQVPQNLQSQLQKQVYGPTSEVLVKSDFTKSGYQPKVQLPFQVPPGQCSRKIELERRRRQYLKLNITQLLSNEGIDSNQLVPRHVDASNLPNVGQNNRALLPTYLPLEVFDDEEFDIRTWAEWLNLGCENGSSERKPVPGQALLPSDDVLGHEDPKSPHLAYEWCSVGILDYNQQKKLYLVHKSKDNKLMKTSSSPTGTPELAPYQYWVPRIRLLFCAEDPYVFTRRIAAACKLRQQTEALLLYNLYIDCMPTDGKCGIDKESVKKMKNYALTTTQLKKDTCSREQLKLLEQEISLEYERTMNKLILDRMVSSNPQKFPYVTLPEKTEERVHKQGRVDVPEYSFAKSRASFTFTTLLTRSEVITSLCKVRTECNKASAMSLFHSTLTKCIRLEEFEQTQSQTFSQVQLFLKDSWVSTLKKAVRSSLRDVGKGWYDLSESNWKVYCMSKLRQLMELVKFNLQDSLRFLVQDSLVSFAQMILDASYSVLSCTEDMKWGGDLVNSPYKPRKNPIFLLDLVLDGSGVHFSTPLENFELVIMTLFDKGILSTHSIPQLEKFVLEKLFISGTPLLESVGLHEPPVEELRTSIRTAIQKALIPLQAYAKQYEKYLELNNTDVETFIKAFKAKTPSAAEIKAAVEVHLLEKERLDNALPNSIIIGPFQINIEGVKQNLSRKRKILSNSLLELLAKSVRSDLEEISEQFRVISRKMYDKPNSVEELTDLREWMNGIPEQLKTLEEQIAKTSSDYDVMDEFFFNLSQEDFNAKWAAIAWPSKITKLTDTIREQHLEDEEKFRKIQVMDQNNFLERLDSLEMVVAGFSAHVDINRVHEVANEVRRVHKQLKDSQQSAQLYNNRERLFELPVTNYDKLLKLVKDFQPFRDLWTTASDWMRWYDSWMNDPLTTIDAEQLEKNVMESYKAMHKCVKYFRDIPACQEVADDIKKRIEEFKPYIPLIQGLRNPGMRSRHWEILSEQIKINVKPKANLTFTRCLEMKLQDHIESIAKVAEIAGKEYSIEQAMDKMENEWASVMFTVMPYKETGTFILKSPEEASQLLDDHIVMVQSMSFSPFKKPFEERISSWEAKLRLTQDVLEEWLTCQRSWLYLEPIFSSEDINRQLPVESKRYQTMERTWRKIMKSAEENKQVISLCPDPRLLQSLRECNKLLELVQKGLSDYLETKRAAFPRFYFLSDDELLEILSQTKDPTAVQPHLRKCFENIARLMFQPDLQITHMYSAEGEEVQLSTSLYPTGNVEDWLLVVEKVMKASVRDYIERSIKAYPQDASDLRCRVQSG